jgi:hypothetical protein
MKTIRINQTILWLVASCFFGLIQLARADAIRFIEPDAYHLNGHGGAVDLATNQNKMILLLVSDTNVCSECFLLESSWLFSTNPPVYPLLRESFILWACGPQEHCSEFRAYTGQGTIGLPMMLIISPTNTENARAVTSGAGKVSNVEAWLRVGLLKSTTPKVLSVVSNAANGTVTISGTSISTNIFIRHIKYRLSDSSVWTSVGATIDPDYYDWHVTVPVSQTASNIQIKVSDVSFNESMFATVPLVASAGPAPLAVQVSPPTNSIGEGGWTSFAALASGGFVPYQYQWQFATQEAGPYTDVTDAAAHFSGANSNLLSLLALLTDAGYYRVVVSDAASHSVTSSPAGLNVTPCGPGKSTASQAQSFPASQPKSLQQVVPLGGTASFAVMPDNPSGLIYRWFRQKGAVYSVVTNDTDHISGADTNVLVIANAGPTDEAAYHVEVWGTCYFGGPTNLVGTLTISDTQPPSLLITNYSDFQHVAATPIGLRGTASDAGLGDHGIVSVKVNGVAATGGTANPSGTARWSSSVGLVSGTNTFSVVATDGVGNATTNIIHIVLDTIPPDTTPPSLAITSHHHLQSLSTTAITLSGTATDMGLGDSGIARVTVNGLTATNGAANGTNTANWSRGLRLVAGLNTFIVIATDNADNATTNVIRLILDTVKPTVVITAPTANQRISNALFTVQGTTKDVGVVTGVWVLTNGVPLAASTANGWSNWTADVTLVPGTNLLKAYATDEAGNLGATSSVKCVYVLISPLTLITNGIGSISRIGFTGDQLEVGQKYSVKAVAAVGQVFSNWTGTSSFTNNPLKFTMVPDMQLQANIVPNPFLPLKGTYAGLFSPTPPDDLAATNSGLFTLTLATNGTFTGKISLAGASLSFKGAFDLSGSANVTVTRIGASALKLALVLDFAQKEITGTVASAAWKSDLRSELAVAAGAQAGRYTLLVDGAANAAASPAGYGAGTVVVATNGSVQASGTLADSTTFNEQTWLGQDGMWPFFASVYGGKGLVMGWMGLDTNALAVWMKRASSITKFYTNGFAVTQAVVVARYQVPTNHQPVLNWTNGLVVVGGGNLPGPLTNYVVLTNNQIKSVSGSLTNLSFTITTNTGLFKGSFKVPGTSQTKSFNGALVQDPLGIHPLGSGGWFLGTNQGGFLLLRPRD